MSHFRPLLPRTGERPLPAPQSLSRKRRGPACEPCRAKRTACNGERPTCTPCKTRRKPCHYATQNDSETRLQALQREHKALTELIEHLRTVPAVTAQAILYELRNSSNPFSVLHRYTTGQILRNPSETAAILSKAPQIHNETELRLQVQHPIAYPALNLSYNSIMSKRTLIDSSQVFVAEQSVMDAPATTNAGAFEASVEADTDHNETRQRHEQAIASAAPASTCLDALVSHLHIDYWTSVAVTDEYAAGAISLYLETDHPMLRLFDAEAFLNDLIYMRSDSCSAFLVNSLLAFASQAYCKTDPTAAAKSLEFEKEARTLWRADCEDSAPNLAGLLLLHISMANNGNGDQGALGYVFESGEMAKRMKLFGVHDRITALESHLPTEDAQYAFRQAAWGHFNTYHLCVHHWIAQPFEYPIALPVPDKPAEVGFDVEQRRFVRSRGCLTPSDEAYMYLCRLCSIDSESLIVLREPSITRLQPLAFTFSRYKKLLDLIDSVPESVKHTNRAPPAVLFFHMYFHRCVMDLFRPYIVRGRTQQFAFRHPEFETPEAIFQASTQQLKGLLIEYTAFHNFASGMMWHPTLLFTANGVLEIPSSPDWRFFFLLCIHCYTAMYDSYSFAEMAIQSLLALAIDFKSISAAEAENILSVTLHRKKKFQELHKVKEEKGRGQGKGSKLKMSDSEARATETLVSNFRELSLFDQFAEVVLYGPKKQEGA
ncbi:hypothetical protein SVAN01_09000 [Stagonosporopsis vannaccii]|nr:hypothetical protein SVAN01_09000 [Stagonosporopsis vannaccii]